MQRSDGHWFYLFVAPWLAGLLLIYAGPMLAALATSLFDWRVAASPRWNGLVNYRDMLSDPLLARVLLNTGLYTLGSVVPGLALGMGLALLLRRIRRGQALLATVTLLPSMLPGVALALAWGWIFNPRYGLVNALLARLGLPGPGWLYDADWALATLVLISLWNCGSAALVYLAALRSLPRELEDSARLDGANFWARLRHVLWPHLAPVSLFLLLANTIAAWQVFTPSYLLTRGGPEHATLTIGLYIHLNAFAWDRAEYAAALGWLLFVICAVLVTVQLRLFRQR